MIVEKSAVNVKELTKNVPAKRPIKQKKYGGTALTDGCRHSRDAFNNAVRLLSHVAVVHSIAENGGGDESAMELVDELHEDVLGYAVL